MLRVSCPAVARKSIPKSDAVVTAAADTRRALPRAGAAASPLLDGQQASRFRRSLLRWFARHGRDLPWRRTRDAYRVVVSEFMLQQTQVARVEGYYARFLEQFPDVQSLALAEPARVREAWQGLGYYRRAVNLQRLAQVVVQDHDGRLPREIGALRLLPGVGRYTAGAVASFAYEQSVAAVDTNVARVLRRAFRPDRPASPADQVLWHAGAALVPTEPAGAWAFNQAIMELGAVLCTARRADCPRCPVQRACLVGQIAGAGTALRGEQLADAERAAVQLVTPAL